VSQLQVNAQQGFPLLLFACILADFASHVRFLLAVFAGSACKNRQQKPLVSAVDAKRAEKWKALNVQLPINFLPISLYIVERGPPCKQHGRREAMTLFRVLLLDMQELFCRLLIMKQRLFSPVSGVNNRG